MSRRIEVKQASKSCLLVRGHGSRELLKDLTRTTPVYATRDRAWVTQPHRLADLSALAESRGYEVIITAVDISICPAEFPSKAFGKVGVPVVDDTVVDNDSRAGGLW